MDLFRLLRAIGILFTLCMLGIVSMISMLVILVKNIHISIPLAGIAVLLSVLYYIYHGLGDDEEAD